MAYNALTGLFELDVPFEPPPLVPYEPVGYGPPPFAAPAPALGELLDQEPAYVSPEPYFGGGGAERRIGDIYPISPEFVAPALDRGPFTPQLEERLPEISRTAPSTIFQPEFVRPYAETAYGYGKQPEPSMEPLRRAAPYVIGALAADPTQGAAYEALEPVRQGVEATTEAIAGAASVGLRGQVGDVDAYRRQAERIREAGLGEGLRRSYQEESIPFVTGAVQEVVNPANLAFGFEPAIARGLIAGTAAAGRVAAPAARAAAQRAGQVRKLIPENLGTVLADERGSLRLPGAGEARGAEAWGDDAYAQSARAFWAERGFESPDEVEQFQQWRKATDRLQRLESSLPHSPPSERAMPKSMRRYEFVRVGSADDIAEARTEVEALYRPHFEEGRLDRTAELPSTRGTGQSRDIDALPDQPEGFAKDVESTVRPPVGGAPRSEQLRLLEQQGEYRSGETGVPPQTDLFGRIRATGDRGEQAELGIGAGEQPLPESGRLLTRAEELAVNRGSLAPDMGQGALPSLTKEQLVNEIDRLAKQLEDLPEQAGEFETSALLDQMGRLQDTIDNLWTREITPEGAQAFIRDIPGEIDALQSYIDTSSVTGGVRDLMGLIAKTGEFAGQIPETISIQTFRKYMGRAPKPTQIDRQRYRFGRVPMYTLADQLATEHGFLDGTALLEEIQNVYRAQQKVAQLRQEAALGRTTEVGAPPPGITRSLAETAPISPGAPAGPAGAAGRVPLLEEPPMGASGITRGGLVSEPASAGAPPTGVALPAEDAMTGAREPTLGELIEQRPPVAGVAAPGGAEATAVTPSVEVPALPEAGGAPPVGPPAGSPPAPPIPPTAPPGHVPPGSPLAKYEAMMELEPPRVGPMLGERYRGLQEQWTDKMAGINGLTSRARKELAEQGQELPMELNAENLVARVPGAGEAGVQRIRDMVTDVRSVLDKGAWPSAENDLNIFLRATHDLDILAAKGTGRKVAGGLKGGPEIQQALRDLEAKLGPQRWTQVQDAASIVIRHTQAGLDRMVQSGLVENALADQLKAQYPHYTPTRIIKLLAEEADAPSKRKLSVTANNLKRFTEQGTEEAAARPLDALMESFVQREALIARNEAARAIAGLAERQGIGKRIGAVRKVAMVFDEAGDAVPVYRRPPGEIRGTISYMDGGKRLVYEVPDWLEKEAKLLRETDFGPVGRWLSAVNLIPRKAFVTYNPSWPAANFMIDAFTNILQGADVREIGKGLVGAIKDIGNNDPVLAEMRRLGAGQAGYFGKTTQDIAKDVRRAGGLAIESRLHLTEFMRNPLRLIGRLAEGQENVGRALEMANRRAAFTTALKAGRTPEEAALISRRATIDFSRSGSFVRQANTAYLFLNASVQGSLLPYRMLRDSPRARWLLGAAIGAKFASDAYNVQYPEYQDIPRHIRYGTWVTMLPSVERDNQGRPKPNYLTVIPNVREWGTFLGPVTYLTEKLFEAAQPEFLQFVATVLPRVQPVSGPADLIPTQIGNVVMELSMNRDFYRNRPIVPAELEGKPATEQYDERTSESIKALAQKLGLSPLQVQHSFFGIAGGAGKAALDVLDPAFASLAPKPEDFRIAELAAQYEAIQAPVVPEDEVALRRREFLTGQSIADQDAILTMTRQQSMTPFLSALERRFHGQQGGELRRLGQEKAEAALGVSPKQTEDRGRQLSTYFKEERVEQEKIDKVFLENRHNPDVAVKWREAHRNKGIRFQGALRTFDVVFPNAADMQDSEKWREYQRMVYTVAGAIDDRRTKGQLLVAGYRAIPLEELDPLTKDFATFFQRRDEYKAALPDEDRALLDRELKASMTEVEKEYAVAQETLRPYWDVRDAVERSSPGATEKAKAAMVTARRKVLRGAHYGDNPINKALVEWYGYERWKPSGPSLIPTPAPYGPAAGRSLVPTVAPVGRR